MGLEFTIPCKVTQDATGQWQIKPPAGVVGFPTAGIDVGTGSSKGVVAGAHSILKTDGTVVKVASDAFWSVVQLFAAGVLKAETLSDGIKYTFGSSGAMEYRAKEAYADITATSFVTIPFAVPVFAKLIGSHMRVDVALDAGDMWDAHYYALAEGQLIGAAQSPNLNTKSYKFYDPNLDSPIVSNTVDIRLTKWGGGNFIAQGRIRAIIYYEEPKPMDDI